jgi:hypothetical protein
MGLPGETRIMQLPALPNEQATYYHARCAKHGVYVFPAGIRFSGRKT